MDLFTTPGVDPETIEAAAPLAWRMRPRKLDEFVGQEHVLGPGKILWRMLRSGRPTSFILHGPPGCGKSAFARLLAQDLASHFVQLNAVSSGVADLKKVREEAVRRQRAGSRTVLFLDEIHRFSRSQQDVLLPMVESGLVVLIGASTHNPFFAIIPPLASRLALIRFEPLSAVELGTILDRALAAPLRGLGEAHVALDDDARRHLVAFAAGDARRLLTALEIAALSVDLTGGERRITLAAAQDSTQQRTLNYDQDEHYDTISAFIKSLRGTDPDAALFWLAKMLAGGEDPLFIARRILIAAAEDVGCADPMALVLAQAAMDAVAQIGLPEARIPLAEAAVYVACAPKSNAAYLGLDRALADVRGGADVTVPEHLRDTSYSGAARMGHGEGYLYPHDYPGNWVRQRYMPHDTIYYRPGGQGAEAAITERLEKRGQHDR